MSPEKKRILKALESEGLVEYKTADPEGGAYGRQGWWEETLAGQRAGVILHRDMEGCGAGEVGYLDQISRGSEILWTEE